MILSDKVYKVNITPVLRSLQCRGSHGPAIVNSIIYLQLCIDFHAWIQNHRALSEDSRPNLRPKLKGLQSLESV